jgi:hypothetical protein
MSTAPTDGSLYAVFSEIPDPRHRRGTVYPLAAVLTLIATAILCGCRSLAAIAQWGRDYNDLVPQLGFSRRTRDGTRYRTPCTSELHTLLALLPAVTFEAALTRWVLARGVKDLPQRVMNLDGKTLRGSQGHQLPGVHLLAAYCRDVEAVVAQLSVPGKTNEHKAALELLKLIPLKGTLITGDAAFTQRDFCEAVVQGEGDYFLTVKNNQPTLEADIRAAFSPAFSPSGAAAAGHRGRPSPQPRKGPRSGGDPPDPNHHAAEGIPELAGCEPGVLVGAGATEPRQGDYRDGLRGHQPRAGEGLGGAAPGDRTRPLEHREPAALGPRSEPRRGCLPSPLRRSTGDPGSGAQRGALAAAVLRGHQHRVSPPPLRRQSTESSGDGHELRPFMTFE